MANAFILSYPQFKFGWATGMAGGGGKASIYISMATHRQGEISEFSASPLATIGTF